MDTEAADMREELAMGGVAEGLSRVSAMAFRFAALVLAALVVAGCQNAPSDAKPDTTTIGATTITTGGAVRIDAGYVGG